MLRHRPGYDIVSRSGFERFSLPGIDRRYFSSLGNREGRFEIRYCNVQTSFRGATPAAKFGASIISYFFIIASECCRFPPTSLLTSIYTFLTMIV